MSNLKSTGSNPYIRLVEKTIQNLRLHLRLVLRSLFIFGIATLLAWALLDAAFVTGGAEIDHATPASVIIVLGCKAPENGSPTPCIRARAAHAAELYKQKLAPSVIASGGPSLEGPAESGVLAELLATSGVPPAHIVQEDRSHNTIQNIYSSRIIMQQHGWTSAILVTEAYHINRAAAIAKDAGLQVYPSPATDSPDWQGFPVRLLKLAEDALKLMLYQVKAATGNYN